MTAFMEKTDYQVAVRNIINMLRYRRPAYSKTERKFSRRYIEPTGAMQDKAGNWILRIGDDRKPSRVAFMSHTDTVHFFGGEQKVAYDGTTIKLPRKSKSDCLGADCTAGVWVMLELIRRATDGLYIFHAGEERGGQGSAWIAKHTPELMGEIDHAISLDRYGVNHVITHQMSRCCSDKFATALSLALGNGYTPNDGGTFTDSANYVDLVPECTNISVGYDGHHTKAEKQNVPHLIWLADVLAGLDFASLPVDRQPGEDDFPANKYFGFMNGWKGRPDVCEMFEPGLPLGDYEVEDNRMVDLIGNNPQAVADLLADLGYTPDRLIDELYAYGAVVTATGRSF